MQKLINLILFQVFLLILVSCAKGPIYQSAYQNKEFKLNELNQDWTGGTLTTSEQGMVYGLSNDENYLYVKLKVVDERNQRKILMNGLVLWFDTEGKAKKKLGYVFPLSNEKARLEINAITSGGKDVELREKLEMLHLETEKVNSRFMKGDEAINVISEDGKVDETFPSHQSKEGVNMMIYIDTYHILYYEARIPLNKIFGVDYSSVITKKSAFSYGFELGEAQLGVNYYNYLINPNAMRNAQMSRGYGISGNPNLMTGTGSEAQKYGVMKVRQRTVQIWVKQARLSNK
ncbi:MAG: hypothetical protein KKG99_04990 [Bacteroidetes bacterium]|nr:hypothetical protein [Bacteroidota bacterium]